MKKIILAGASLNSGNRGVNALTRGQIMLLLNKYGFDLEIVILSFTVSELVENVILYKNKEMKIREVPCSKKSLIDGYLKSKLFLNNYILNELRTADAVWDISEGDSFSDIYGVKRFIQHSLIKLITIKLKTKLYIMPQTLGPFKRSWVKFSARKILNSADKVFVRDEISKTVVEKDLCIKREIKYIPDMAFYMEPDKNISIKKFFLDNDTIKVGINISALLYNGGYTGNNMFSLKVDYKMLLEELVQTFAKMNNVEVILIPHVMTKEFEIEDDFRVCKKVAENISNKINIKIKTIDKFYREDEIKAIISGCDFFIGSRMHACIAAISTLVPTTPISYSRKFIGIWDKLSLGSCVADPRTQSEKDIVEIILDNFNKREKIKIKLNEKIPLLKKEIEEIFSIIEV